MKGFGQQGINIFLLYPHKKRGNKNVSKETLYQKLLPYMALYYFRFQDKIHIRVFTKCYLQAPKNILFSHPLKKAFYVLQNIFSII